VLGLYGFVASLATFPIAFFMTGIEPSGGAFRFLVISFLIYVTLCAVVLRSRVIVGTLMGVFLSALCPPMNSADLMGPVYWAEGGALTGLVWEACIHSGMPANTP
jgi:hypothetical protein